MKRKSKPFIAVIGLAHNGKTTIIQSLTGSRKNIPNHIKDKKSGYGIYVIASSPQESGMKIGTFRTILRNVIFSQKCLGLVVAIQPTEPIKRISMEDMFRVVESTGRFQMFAFMLNPPHSGKKFKATVVQKRLSKFNIHYDVLDARRFAYFNAHKIQKKTRLIK